MTANDEHVNDMRTPLLDDEAIEALFLATGQSSWAQDDALATLAEQVLVATGGPPPRPHGALLAFLEDSAPGLVAVPSLAPGAASPGQPRAAVGPATPTHRNPNLRLLSRRLRLRAGIAAGIGIAAAALTVAGTTAALPDPAMRAIVRVVEAVTPFELTEPSTRPPTTLPSQRPDTTSTVPVTAGTGSLSVGQSGSTEQSPAVTPPSRSPGSVPPSVQAPVAPGSPGLDQVGQTPAGPFIPPFVTGPAGDPPAPSGGGSGPPSTGVERARGTPAGSFVPPFTGAAPGRR